MNAAPPVWLTTALAADLITPVATQVERAARDAIAEVLGIAAADVAVEVRPAPRAGRTHFVVAPDDAHRAALLDAGVAEEVRRRLERAPGVMRAIAVPPRFHCAMSAAFLREVVTSAERRGTPATGRGRVVLTFSDPNLNKPLHVGHARNNVLGMAISGLLRAAGFTVERQAVHSDWGIHIAQAVAGYLARYADATPESEGVGGDAFVGRCYAAFHAAAPDDPDLAAMPARLLQDIVNGDPEALRLHRRVVRWAEEGINATYARLGTRHDRVNYESAGAARARRMVLAAMTAGICEKREDGSIYVTVPFADSTADVTLVRADRSPVVYTQWLGVDFERFQCLDAVAVLQLSGAEWTSGEALYRQIATALGAPWARLWFHVAHGLVRTGDVKLSSRKGHDFTAEGLLDAACAQVARLLATHGVDAPAETVERLGVGLAKYRLLRVQRTKDVTVENLAPSEDDVARYLLAVGLLGWSRRRASEPRDARGGTPVPLLLAIDRFESTVASATQRLDPALLVRYVDDLAALAARTPDLDADVARAVARVLAESFDLLALGLRDDDAGAALALAAAGATRSRGPATFLRGRTAEPHRNGDPPMTTQTPQPAVTSALPGRAVAAVYDHLAEEYDDRIENDSATDTAFVRTELDFMLARVRPEDDVLDLGCGTGRIAVPIASRARSVTGVDLSVGMLGRATERANAAGVTLTLRQANIMELPFDDASFDVVTSALVLMHVPPEYRRTVFHEVARVLRPGGRFVFSVKNALFERIVAVDRFVSADRTDARKHEMVFTDTRDGVEHTTPWHSFSPADVAELACATGFGVVHQKGNLPVSAFLADQLLAHPTAGAVVRALDEVLGEVPPFSHLGYYTLVDLMKRP